MEIETEVKQVKWVSSREEGEVEVGINSDQS